METQKNTIAIRSPTFGEEAHRAGAVMALTAAVDLRQVKVIAEVDGRERGFERIRVIADADGVAPTELSVLISAPTGDLAIKAHAAVKGVGHELWQIVG